MPTLEETMAELQAMGEENVKKIWLKHGIKEPFFGVKIENLKKLQKKIKTNYPLAKELYATGNADAMYLAGLVTDDNQMTKEDLNQWVRQAESSNIYEYTVPWVASQGKYGYELALEWIDNPEPLIATAGWATLSCHVALTPDEQLDIPFLKEMLGRIVQTIHSAGNRVRHKMNGFVIALGSYVAPMTEDAIAAAKTIGFVKVNMNGTACKVPDAVEYIMKVKNKGAIGKKKKEVKC
ncbi:DNA alkylation repair protein [Parasediminibacterium sp. JCM 36343]|uniref:DNA alkylation repair protein n=1 Tax=Parasediminibacterium sp. JCM 36343 TaxID=3374279 RepID=UPI0039794F85